MKQKVVLQLFEFPMVKFHAQFDEFGVVLVKSTHSGAQPDAGEGDFVVNEITGNGFTVIVTVAVAGVVVQLSVTETVYVVVTVGLTYTYTCLSHSAPDSKHKNMVRHFPPLATQEIVVCFLRYKWTLFRLRPAIQRRIYSNSNCLTDCGTTVFTSVMQ